MPRYFFHVEDDAIHADEEGIELSGLDAARHHAVCYFAELLRDAPSAFWTRGEWLMRVTDAGGLVFFTLDFVATNAAAGGGVSRHG